MQQSKIPGIAGGENRFWVFEVRNNDPDSEENNIESCEDEVEEQIAEGEVFEEINVGSLVSIHKPEDQVEHFIINALDI